MAAAVVVTGGFDDIRSHHIRLLEEAANGGEVHVLIQPDARVKALTGRPPKFPAEERLYIVQAIRFVKTARIMSAAADPDVLPALEGLRASVWIMAEGEVNEARRRFCAEQGLELRAVPLENLRAIPRAAPLRVRPSKRSRVIVTGCFDWLHSGHVRFFEEAASLGELFVDVGSDDNIRRLKGNFHPLFPQDERLYLVRAIRTVAQAFIGSGYGWLDAAPEIARIKPAIYLVNEDGDRPEKRAFCEERGIRYVVLKRIPRPGLAPRDSTALRGF